jgi:hypothetical protein
MMKSVLAMTGASPGRPSTRRIRRRRPGPRALLGPVLEVRLHGPELGGDALDLVAAAVDAPLAS